MEAARVLALRGHKVTLYEKEDRLGGQLRYACVPPGREEIQNMITYLEKQMVKLNVAVKTGREVDLKTLENENPDAVVVATGGNPIMLDLPGIKGSHVYPANSILDGNVPMGKNVIVIGGGTVGCEVALYAAKQGAMSPDVACFLARHKVFNEKDIVEYTTRETGTLQCLN